MAFGDTIGRVTDAIRAVRYAASVDARAYRIPQGIVGLLRVHGRNETTPVTNIYVPFQKYLEVRLQDGEAFFYGRLNDLVKNFNMEIGAQRQAIGAIRFQQCRDRSPRNPQRNNMCVLLQKTVENTGVDPDVYYRIPLEELHLPDRRKGILQEVLETMKNKINIVVERLEEKMVTPYHAHILAAYPKEFAETVSGMGYVLYAHRSFEWRRSRLVNVVLPKVFISPMGVRQKRGGEDDEENRLYLRKGHDEALRLCSASVPYRYP